MTDSSVAKDALARIGRLYDIERAISGQSARKRLEMRDRRSRPIAAAFHQWINAQLPCLPDKGNLAKAMRCGLTRWPSFVLFLDDGRVAIDNNPAERAVKPAVIGWKSWMFAESDAGGETLADAMIVIETARMSGLNPEARLADVLARINDHVNPMLDELLPWNWKTSIQNAVKAAWNSRLLSIRGLG